MLIDPTPTLETLGGKAYQLYRLKQRYNVPPFFVLVFVNPDEISDPLNQQRIIELCHDNSFDLMAVRSSANCEDSPETSFAGMFKTVLGVQSFGLISAVTEVLSSVHSERVAEYCEAWGLSQDKVRMAVIIQKMINSRVSGVCFTRMQNNNNALLIEACYGLGDALVSGKITPDSFIVNRDDMSIAKETVGYQKIMLSLDKNKMVFEDVPFHKRNARKLTNDQVMDVARTCVSIEQCLGFPAADVEWAFDQNILYLLQARPYTGFIEKTR